MAVTTTMDESLVSDVLDKNLKAVEDTAKALDYKRAGMTYRQIGLALNRTALWVSTAIQRYAEEHAVANLAAMRAEVLEREQGIIAAHWPTRQNPQSAKVIQESDRIIIQITGIEARKEIDITGAITISDGAHQQLISGLASLAAKLAAGESPPGLESESGSGSALHVAGLLGEAESGRPTE